MSHLASIRRALGVGFPGRHSSPARWSSRVPCRKTAPDTPTFASGTAQVVLDVVVRDKKGRPVLDVRPEELEVYEQGVQQTVEGFKLVESEGAEVGRERPHWSPSPTSTAGSTW